MDDTGVRLADATAKEIGEELARRGRATVRLATLHANLAAGKESDTACPDPKSDCPVLSFLIASHQWVSRSDLRRRFRGPDWVGDKLTAALQAALDSGFVSVRNLKTPAGRVEQQFRFVFAVDD